MRILLKARASADALSKEIHRFLETQTNLDTQPSEEGKDIQVDTMFPGIPPPETSILSSLNDRETKASRKLESAFLN